MGRNTDSIWTTPPLPYSLIIVKVIQLEKSLLVAWKVLRLFVNTLTADERYSLLNRNDSMRTIQMHLLQKQKTFSEFFMAFLKSASNFAVFQKGFTLIGYVFQNLRTPNDVVRYMSKKSPFEMTTRQATW